jgi:hypothetical protein
VEGPVAWGLEWRKLGTLYLASLPVSEIPLPKEPMPFHFTVVLDSNHSVSSLHLHCPFTDCLIPMSLWLLVLTETCPPLQFHLSQS